MQILALDHVNLRTARLDRQVAFYTSVLGLSPGPRPAFAFGGAWLYAGERPIVHLVEAPVDEATAPGAGEPRLSHFALRASGLRELLSRLDQAGVARQVTRLPGTDVTQVHFTDPDGNALHVDFAGT